MAKTRVSHLAKEFNLDVKELILRLREINIEVDNYLSSIEATDVARAREMLAKAVPLVEEQRVGSNVKRRRALARTSPVTGQDAAASTFSRRNLWQSNLKPKPDLLPGSPAEAAPAQGKSGPLVSTQKRRKVGEKPARILPCRKLPNRREPEP